ncbi:hypothetical protein CEXT_554031 [Caerostris extrusa]|uniref:Uncharacterized protein n=1 Tax=Caerostris extrusa TaxID=172846 RepID=A0AAV4P7M8_CAEEX|nr:hypothetical protein CEXT_554031 [Caerostris extrusa]
MPSNAKLILSLRPPTKTVAEEVLKTRGPLDCHFLSIEAAPRIFKINVLLLCKTLISFCSSFTFSFTSDPVEILMVQFVSVTLQRVACLSFG